MNEQGAHLFHAIRGPVILITVGVLFAIDRFSGISFSKTWPILLIVIGLLRLAAGPRSRFREYERNPGGQYDPVTGQYVPPTPPNPGPEARP